MGLDIYFYKVKKENVKNTAEETYRAEEERCLKEFTAGVLKYSTLVKQARKESSRTKYMRSLIKFLDKTMPNTSHHCNLSETSDNKVLDETIKDCLLWFYKAYIGYFRKEYDVLDFLARRHDTEVKLPCFINVTRDDIKTLIPKYKSFFDMHTDDNDETEAGVRMLKGMLKTLKSDETLYLMAS